jgi:hypothetical protein
MQQRSLTARLDHVFSTLSRRRPAAQCAAIAGTAAMLAFTPAAHAVVVVSPASNIVIPVTTAGIYINVLTGAAGTAAGTTGWDINPWGSGSLFVYGATGGGMVSTGGAVAALFPGSVVGPGSTFAVSPSAATVANGWALNATNYFGFSFLNENNGLVHYGYGSINIGAAFTTPGRAVVNLFYESQPGVAFAIAPIPEPSTWALMVGGLAAVGALARRRRHTQA